MANSPTGGFARASVMPDAAVTDPRLLALDLSSILRGAGQGLQLAGAYGQTRDAALARQEAAALAEPRLAAMRSQYELAPQLAQNQLELSNYAVAKGGLPIQLDDASYGVNEQIRLDAQGQPYATPDVMLQQTVTEFDPVTRTRRQVQRNVKPLATIESQAAAEAAAAYRIENNDIKRAQAEATAARQVAMDAEREANRLRIENKDKEIIGLRKDAEARLTRQGDERIKAGNDARAATQRASRIRDMRNQKTPNDVKLSEYLAKTRDPTTGELLTKRDATWYLPEDKEPRIPVDTDPVSERMVAEYYRFLDAASGGAASPVITPSEAEIINEPISEGDRLSIITAPTPARSVVDQQALQWAQANPNDPRSGAILQRLGR